MVRRVVFKGPKAMFSSACSIVSGLCSAAILLSCTPAERQPLPPPGALVADEVCSLCHGLTGQSISPEVPKLAGQQKAYLTKQLTHFRGHEHLDEFNARYMRQFAQLSDGQIDELSEYFSAQPPMTAQGDGGQSIGEAIYRSGLPNMSVSACRSCHGSQAQGSGSIPRLAGQHAPYLSQRLEVLAATQSSVSSSHSLPPAAAEMVALYLASLEVSK
jgi:cytochrome c553